MANKIELGSEFELDINKLKITTNNIRNYFKEYATNWYDLGRSAIRHIPFCRTKKILLPEYICESVIKCFDIDKISFYKIDDDLTINESVLDMINEDVGTIYICHYFGYCQDESLLHSIKQKCDKYDILIIEDSTQSMFSVHNYIGDYMVASIRKWIPVPCGGVLFSNSKKLPSMEEIVKRTDDNKFYGMVLKQLHLDKNLDVNEQYRKIFVSSEENFDEQKNIYGISDLSAFLIECANVDELISIRKRNASYLQERIGRMGIDIVRKFNESECPLVVLVRVNNRDDFRKYLIDNRIYCAVHWPFDGIKKEERLNAAEYAGKLLSLPIDQRYGTKEIEYMIKVIEGYGGKLTF